MSFDAPRLLSLLPALYHTRDVALARAAALLPPAEAAELELLEKTPGLTPGQQARQAELAARRDRGPLGALLEVLSGELAVLEEDLEQLYDDQFIETCADWVVPYIGDLVGWQGLHGSAYAPGSAAGSARAEVAHTLAYRRRKGTAAVLEQLARDVTGWNARAVEFFALLATTQHMNHVRPQNPYAPDLRDGGALARIGGAFDPVPHTVDVRRAASGRGRYNLPSVGIFLWRLDAYSATRVPAVRVDDRRWRLSPLGHDLRLFNRPETEDEIAHLAQPENVPEPLERRALAERLAACYGPSGTLALYVGGALVPAAAVRVCDLSDHGAGWAHLPPDGEYAVDPVLGRVALPGDLVFPTPVAATWHYGFSADLGGGEYDRAGTFAADPAAAVVRVPADQPTIQDALDALGGDGVVEVTDNRRYEEAPQVSVAAGGRIELRAADGRRPTLALTGEMTVTGGARGELTLNGLLVTGEKLRVPAAAGNRLAVLRLAHLTLVPGWTLDAAGDPQHPAQPSLVVETGGTEVLADRVIVGGVRVAPRARARFADSIVDALAPGGVAYAAPGGGGGGELELDAVTAVGKVHATVLRRVSNSILLARLAAGDGWSAPVLADRRQEGCVRFTWLPPAARVPRRFHCQPDAGDPAVVPRFTSLRYAVAAYCQLAASTSDTVARGADDEGEMGAFHSLYAPQRESNLRFRLDEYLRVGLEAGIFHAT
ncbi:MAG TPA: hypothetical protein VGO40_08655 [Longimicrobium sp.]|jgi:hypothetical protein|nr:hypothetical protein [Longimicrobium sp.]